MILKPLLWMRVLSVKLLLILLLCISGFQLFTLQADISSAEARLKKAIKLIEIGEYEEAKTLLLSAIPVFEAAKAGAQYLEACNQLDDCFYELGRYQEGADFFTNASKTADQYANSQELKAYFFYFKAMYHSELGESQEALWAYEQAYPFAEAVGYMDGLTGCYSNLGTLYWNRGNHAKGLEFQLKSLSFTENPEVKAKILRVIGDSYRSMKDVRSLDYFHQSLALNARDPQTLIQFSKAYAIFGKSDSAFHILSKALLVLHEDDLTGKADCYYQYTQLYLERRDYPKATAFIEQAMIWAEEGYGADDAEYARFRTLHGKVQLATGKSDKALACFHQNLLSQSVNVSPDLDSTQNPTLEQLSAGSFWVLESLDGKGEAFLEKYQQTQKPEYLDYALHAFDLALDYGENMRLSYGHESSKIELYEYLNPAVKGGIETAMRMAEKSGNHAWYEKAFSFAERVKAAAMAEALYDKNIKHLTNIPELEEERQLQQQIAKLEIQMNNVPDSAVIFQDSLLNTKLLLTKLEGRLEKKYPRYYHLKYAFKKDADPRTILDHLEEDVLLLEYFKSDSTLYTFALSHQKLKAYVTKVPLHFDSTLLKFHRATSDWKYIQQSGKSAEQDFLTAAPQLYDWLLAKPLADFKAKRLILVPDDALGGLSFDALLTRPHAGTWQDRDIPYLMREYAISYAWSASAAAGQDQADNHGAPLAFGGFGTQYEDDPQPIAMRDDLGPLPNADDEVRAIGKIMGGQSWLNDEATKHSFLKHAPFCDILHIATHGILNAENPMQSHLVFNKTDPEAENRLFASELYNLDLHARLAVLSACNTGAGKVAAGEGNMSIARALAYAGCPALVSNLWSADDQASAKIMELFYQNLKKGLTKDEALRQAKLTYLKEMDASVALPAYWASFVVIGQCDALAGNTVLPLYRWGMMGALLLAVAFFLYRRYRAGSIKWI